MRLSLVIGAALITLVISHTDAFQKFLSPEAYWLNRTLKIERDIRFTEDLIKEIDREIAAAAHADRPYLLIERAAWQAQIHQDIEKLEESRRRYVNPRGVSGSPWTLPHIPSSAH